MKLLSKTPILLLLFTLALFTFARAQNWSPVASGTLDYPVNAFAVYQGSLIAGGETVYRLNNQQWETMETGLKSFFGAEIFALGVNNGVLYCGGKDFHVETPDQNLYNNVARYTGSAWTTVGSGTGNDGTGMYGEVYFLSSFRNQLHAGGTFNFAGGDPWNQTEAKHAAVFTGDNCCWAEVGGGLNGNMLEMLVDPANDVLYVVGEFTQAGNIPANRIARWDGQSWSAMGNGVDGKISSVALHNGELYIGGQFQQSGSTAVNHIARWNGSSWVSVGTGLDNSVFTLASYHGELYAGGDNLQVNTFPSPNQHVMRWDGSSWKTLGSGTNGPVYTFQVFNDDLIMGGNFTEAGGINCSKTAKWNVLSTGLNESARESLSFYPNPIQPGNTLHLREAAEWTLYDAQGRKLQNGKGSEVMMQSEYPAGLYWIVASNSAGTRSGVVQVW